ncbi:MAG: YdcF family protein [Oscillospiraceae bacterium]|nr:YdcF family protein [Oscillospiraceae bacterium]
MKKHSENVTARKLRRIMIVIISVASYVLTVVSFIMMLLGFPGMDIVFFLALLMSCIISAYMLLKRLKASERHARLATVLMRCMFICIAAGLAGFFVLQGLIFSGAHSEESQADCIIILGAGIYGEYPSRILLSRLDAAIEYMGSYDDIPIIVSGGQGPGESISEAEAMLRYLSRKGVDESRIIKEEASTSTWENLSYSFDLMAEMGMDSDVSTVAIVTNDFHLYRAKHIAGTFGVDAVGVSAKTPYPSLRVLYHFREAVALMKDFLLI